MVLFEQDPRGRGNEIAKSEQLSQCGDWHTLGLVEASAPQAKMNEPSGIVHSLTSSP
jgi:hypothetical protein